ncbi:MAG: hypothetical protein QXW82_06830 [Candidatus Bathyarchaeia archaeon]
MGSLRENLKIIREILTSRWYWIIVLIGIAVFLTPYILVLVILYLPPPFNAITTIGIVIAWGIVAGYKDWLTSKKKEESS